MAALTLQPSWRPSELRAAHRAAILGGFFQRTTLNQSARFWMVRPTLFPRGRPNLARGPPDLAAGRPWWRQGGPLTTKGRFHHFRRLYSLFARWRRTCSMETSHTIVLIQYNLQSSSRTYLDYEGLPRALDGACSLPAAATRDPNLNRRRYLCAAICGLYEKELKTLNPQIRDITYDIADLYNYLDQLHDLSCLV